MAPDDATRRRRWIDDWPRRPKLPWRGGRPLWLRRTGGLAPPQVAADVVRHIEVGTYEGRLERFGNTGHVRGALLWAAGQNNTNRRLDGRRRFSHFCEQLVTPKF
jgi:hypothetical protein